jgi:DNA repair protein RecO (recombination protein O)
MESQSERRQRLYRVSAIVLKRRDSGEADRLLTVLARERGKLTLLAKGVRRPASRKAGHIEPFTYVDLLVARSHNLDLVTQAETRAAHRRLREDLWRNSWAYYVAELADAFTQEGDPNELAFDLLLETLERLDGDANPALVTRYFEMHLLGLAGFQPQLFRCLQCGVLLKPEVNYLSLERGGALCPEHGAAQHDTIALPLAVFKVLRFLQTRSWEDVVRLQLGPQVSQEVETLMSRYIVYHLERNLSSTAFIQRLRNQMARLAAEQAPGAAAIKTQTATPESFADETSAEGPEDDADS